MFYKEINNFLTKQNIDFIEKLILTNDFPYFIYDSPVEKEKSPYLSHVVVRRPEDKNPGINSPHYMECVKIILSALSAADVQTKNILRIAINLTYNNGMEKCKIHEDHDYPHKQLLLCLNDPLDKNSKTIILDDDKETILKEVIPKKYTGIIFDNKPHYHFYPKQGHRIMFVATFN